MKRLFLIIFLITFPILSAVGKSNIVTLTANDVTGAEDIEYAINTATGYGAYPGTVILDSSDGDFSFESSDKSINIFVSNFKLMSKNGANITNCEGAINFDAIPASNVTIQGITFNCSGDGITASDFLNKNIIIHKNKIVVPGIGISFGQIEDSTITNNIIQSDWGIHLLSDSSNTKIMHNEISSSSIGIFLQDVNLNHVLNNQISTVLQGIRIGYGSDSNLVNANEIIEVQYSGIALDGNNYNNHIHGNSVTCQTGSECLIVNAVPELFLTNIISGNH
jgi:parallel beta-helix repeat protein